MVILLGVPKPNVESQDSRDGDYDEYSLNYRDGEGDEYNYGEEYDDDYYQYDYSSEPFGKVKILWNIVNQSHKIYIFLV